MNHQASKKEAFFEHGVVIGVLLVWGTLLWFGALFRPMASWDEDIFLMMAQDVARGHLPYVHVWDIKPPLLFWITGLFYKIWPTVWGVRLLCMFYYVIAAWIGYAMLARLAGKPGGWVCALLLMLLTRMLPNFTAEHIALLPMMAMLWCVFCLPFSRRSAIFLGLCMSAAVLIRTNLVSLFPFALAVHYYCATQRDIAFWRFCVMTGAVFAVPHLYVFALYAAAGEWELIWATHVLVPLRYPLSAKQDWGAFAVELPQRVLPAIADKLQFTSWVSLLLMSFPAGVLGGAISNPRERKICMGLLCMLAGGVLTIMIIGRSYLHYWVQLIPFASVIFGYVVQLFWQPTRYRRVSLAGALAAYVIYSYAQPLIETSSAELKRVRTTSLTKLYWPYEVAAVMKRYHSNDAYVLSCRQPIFSVLAGGRSATRFASQQVSYMHDMIEGEDADYIAEGMGRNPLFIVDPPNSPCIKENKAILEKYFSRIYNKHNIVVYRRDTPEAWDGYVK